MPIICQLYRPLIIPNLCYIYVYYELHHYNEAINVYHPSSYVSSPEAINIDLVQQIKFCIKWTIATWHYIISTSARRYIGKYSYRDKFTKPV